MAEKPIEETLLSPWAHPKAQRWFSDLLDRSGFIHTMEDELQIPSADLDLGRVRMMLAFLMLLGRPGVWPKNRKKVLQVAAMKIFRKANEPPEVAGSNKKLTLDQHKKLTKSVDAIQLEIEVLRRFAGISNRKSPLKCPPSWGKFWN